MSAIAQPKPRMTVEEFLAWDGGGHVGKLELVDGVARAMAPASATHAIIQGNLVAAIHAHLRRSGSSCRVAPEAPIRPAMGKGTNARAPDIAVTCAPPSTSKTFDEPILIIEVLSPSKEDGTWESIRALAPLPTLQEIVLVQSEIVRLEIYRRSPSGAWQDEPDVITNADAKLESIDLTMTVADIYSGTHLATS